MLFLFEEDKILRITFYRTQDFLSARWLRVESRSFQWATTTGIFRLTSKLRSTSAIKRVAECHTAYFSDCKFTRKNTPEFVNSSARSVSKDAGPPFMRRGTSRRTSAPTREKNPTSAIIMAARCLFRPW
jgi:hypothetical protein